MGAMICGTAIPKSSAPALKCLTEQGKKPCSMHAEKCKWHWRPSSTT